MLSLGGGSTGGAQTKRENLGFGGAGRPRAAGEPLNEERNQKETRREE